ncbi:hypothetical protein CTAYLR_002018 [Chrysophaeum taylorii]|uniref:Hexose transporter 1 n=1 Tax=Chrysophaeum taylorii TaxID=2483200 RepID=A0AAD7U8P2_9STRA|nr:hypothetical protein CTAYLR_002018 [Chrysophaeum taylorii]
MNARSSPRVGLYVYALTSIAALNSMNLGFDIGVFPDAALRVQEEWGLSDAQLETLVGVLELAAICGAASAHVVNDRKGRRATFVASCCAFILGVGGMCFSTSYGELFAFRVCTGIGVGVGFSVDPVYIAEIAPPHHRGELVTWSEVAVNLGIVTGFVAAYALGSWRLMLACGLPAPCLLTALTLTVMPESPKWLMAHGRLEEAKRVLERLRLEQPPSAEPQGSWRDLWRAKRALGLALFVAVSQQVMAEQVLLYYQPQILRAMNLPRARIFAARLAMGLLKTICAVISGRCLDSRGRRVLLLIGIAAMGASLSGIALCFALDAQVGVVVLIWLYMCAFSLGIGPICWLYASEILPFQCRAKGMALATCANKLTSFVISSTFLTWAHAMPGTFSGYFAVFAVVAVVVWLLVLRHLPETKNKSLDEIQSEFSYSSRPADDDDDPEPTFNPVATTKYSQLEMVALPETTTTAAAVADEGGRATRSSSSSSREKEEEDDEEEGSSHPRRGKKKAEDIDELHDNVDDDDDDDDDDGAHTTDATPLECPSPRRRKKLAVGC